MSPGERALLRLRWFVYDAGSRPVVIAAVLVLMAVLSAIAASMVTASTESFGGFRQWLSVASLGFRTEVLLGILVAAVLLVIDALTGESFPGQRALFWLVAVTGAAAVVANVGDAASRLTQIGIPGAPQGTTAEVKTVIIVSYAAPTVLAAIAVWMAIVGARSLTSGRGVER